MSTTPSWIEDSTSSPARKAKEYKLDDIYVQPVSSSYAAKVLAERKGEYWVNNLAAQVVAILVNQLIDHNLKRVTAKGWEMLNEVGLDGPAAETALYWAVVNASRNIDIAANIRGQIDRESLFDHMAKRRGERTN